MDNQIKNIQNRFLQLGESLKNIQQPMSDSRGSNNIGARPLNSNISSFTKEVANIFGKHKSPCAKRKKPNAIMSFQPKNTWTGNFFCLSKANHYYTPTALENDNYKNAGLGFRRIEFGDKKGDHIYLINRLESEYPKLSEVKGAFLLYKAASGGSGARSLHKIQMGPCGYTIPWLRYECKVGSSCIYIMPLQCDLSMDSISTRESIEKHQFTPMVACRGRSKDFYLHEMEEHLAICNNKSVQACSSANEKGQSNELDGSASLGLNSISLPEVLGTVAENAVFQWDGDDTTNLNNDEIQLLDSPPEKRENRLRLKPLRFRHSIGSPSLLNPLSTAATITTSRDESYINNPPAVPVSNISSLGQNLALSFSNEANILAQNTPIATEYHETSKSSTQVPIVPQVNNVQSECFSQPFSPQLQPACSSGAVLTQGALTVPIPSFSAFDEREKEGSSSFFGDEEVKRFFLAKETETSSEAAANQSNFSEESSTIQEFFEHLKNKYKQLKKKPLIVQREIERFWNVIFRQKFDFSKHCPSVRFSGETAAGIGPMREFLTLAMRNLSLLKGIVGGENAYLKSFPDALLERQYYMIGQIIGVAIVNIGKGPHCFNEMVVKAILNQPIDYTSNIAFPDDSYLNYYLNEIEKGKSDCLLENNIQPTVDVNKNKKIFSYNYIIFSNNAAIEQVRNGFISIDEAFLEPRNVEHTTQFLKKNNVVLTINNFLELLHFHNDNEPGSNLHTKTKNAICYFELFLTTLDQNESKYSLEDLLFFFTSMDTVPLFGFWKLIDIYFLDEDFIPKSSTCALKVDMPMNEIEEKMKIALEFGVGYGDI